MRSKISLAITIFVARAFVGLVIVGTWLAGLGSRRRTKKTCHN